MTLLQLKKRVDHFMENERNHDLEVVIPNNKQSTGPIATTPVASAGQGIDWNKHLFIIHPANKMTEI